LISCLFLIGQAILFASNPELKSLQKFHAPQANQAAAADKEFFYAIGNRVITKHDRNTGKELAKSSGKAKHLNSGYFHQGKLLCAHSNFPTLPEQSEVLSLDPKTMRITVYRDLGNPGGSLTWVVQKKGNWWCSFARYGKKNAETFVIKYDNHWKEIARFTYPQELINQLGKYSVSGGIWVGEELWVTGHDDPVLFRLSLPRQGNVLVYHGTIKVPFTGQGIAHDPLSGGLLGIDRKRKKVIFLR
jgi:hypothetical protein